MSDRDFKHNLSYAGHTPEECIEQINWYIDMYSMCFIGPVEFAQDLSDRIVDSVFRDRTDGLPVAEQQRRAAWLKAEMKRRLQARGISAPDSAGEA